MPDEIAISVKNVSKNFVLPHERVSTVKGLFTSAAKKRNKSTETQHALRDISFEIKKGEFFGIVGRNGSGKSTMLKILAGIYQPTKGSVSVKGRLVPFIELGVGFNGELTGRENVYLNGAMLGFSHKELDAMYDDIVEFAELERFMDQKLKNYSSGMQVRLAFSMATRANADILLVDEVLAVGDADFQRKCFEFFKSLKKNKKTVVFVSHDMTAVREYCDRAVLIEKSYLVEEGSTSRVTSSYTKMFMQEANQPEKAETVSTSRWGDKKMTYKSVKLSHAVLGDEAEVLAITATVEAKEAVDNPVFGFSVKDASGLQILGTNSQIRNRTISKLEPGEIALIEWTVPNIFADGKHSIDLAAVYHDGTQVAEWWEDAKKFKVVRKERTPYVVSPHIGLNVSTQ